MWSTSFAPVSKALQCTRTLRVRKLLFSTRVILSRTTSNKIPPFSNCPFRVSSSCHSSRRWSSNTPGDEEDEDKVFVYESPLGSVVTRLRTVSLITGIIGSVGLPIVVAIKGDLPSTGLLMMGMAFVTGTLGSTAAIHFVFHPYVYAIEQIPVRKCHYKKKTNPEDVCEEKTTEPKKKKDVLLKAISRSLFLTQVETVFDPATDVLPYKGLRPLCNFTAKGVLLYVHPEYIYDQELRKAMNLDKGKVKLEKHNPDDFL